MNRALPSHFSFTISPLFFNEIGTLWCPFVKKKVLQLDHI
jgi:hypothetical protein